MHRIAQVEGTAPHGDMPAANSESSYQSSEGLQKSLPSGLQAHRRPRMIDRGPSCQLFLRKSSSRLIFQPLPLQHLSSSTKADGEGDSTSLYAFFCEMQDI